MHRQLPAAAFAAIITSLGPAAAQDACGPVSIAEMNWASAGVTAQIDRLILEEGYGCEVEMVTGDTVPTFTSMNEKGTPDVAPELWMNAIKDQLDAAVAEGRLVIAGDVLTEGGVEGWWIPKYVADAHPEIRTVEDALAHPELFPAPENPDRGGVVGCPAGWTCQAVTANIFKARDAEAKGFELIDPGSAAGLDGSIAAAYERQAPWLGYYWAPTALLGKYEMVRLDPEVAHDPVEIQRCTSVPDCPDPKLNDYANARVVTVVTSDFAEAAGPAMAYLGKRSFDNATMGGLLAWMEGEQATNEEAARHFLTENEAVWTPWVPEDVAGKVRTALK